MIPSSSSFSYRWSYDVFLSFRGQDTRHGFTGNLYNALVQREIRTFIDDEELQRGEEITPSLFKAIEESRIAIVVISKNYASSSFCLDELVYILDCIKGKGRLVLPIFYDVDPSHVRHHGEVLAKHEKKFKDNDEKLQKWRKALHQAANLSGWHFKHGDGYEYKFIGKIVEEVASKINRAPLHVAHYPVGLESRVLQVISLLDVGFDDGVQMVGIHGIGGMGKTTVALAVYNLIADSFEGICFLGTVRENSMKHGLVHLQEMLLSKIAGEKDIKLGDVNEGISMIKHRLHRKKVLLILDDVDKLEQLRVIVGKSDWLGSGSRVIITTRDKHLLASHGVKRTYEVEKLNEEEALELLVWNAFKTDKVDPSYVNILNCTLTFASGLPLALEVIGSNLFGKRIEEWESALDQYKTIPNKEIQQILKVSFDALEEYQQKIFLDIACCFKGYELAHVEQILCAHHGGCPKYGIGVLVEKSLIKIDNCGEVKLHDLIQDMGREIVRQESPEKPGKRSRLWFYEDIVHVLEENVGTSEIEIINLDSPIFEEEVNWDGEAFKKMKNLKTLIIRNGRFSKGPKHLPNSLRVLEWWGYPSPSLPSDFRSKKLAIFKLPRSCLTLVTLPERKKLVNLRVLDISYSKCITEIVDVSGVPNLEELSFGCCKNLIKIHESVGFLNKLRILDAYYCKRLRSFPPLMLPSLKKLNLSECSRLESFPEILGKMQNITKISLEHTSIKELPFSIRNLTRLRSIELERCGIVQLPSSIVMLPELEQLSVWECEGLRSSKQDEGEDKVSSILSSKTEYLVLRKCNISDEFLQIGLALFANLKELDLSCNNFTILPPIIKECRFLRSLNLDYCENLREIRGIPPNLERFCARHCTSLKDLDLTLLPACTKECCFLRKLFLDDCENLQEIRGITSDIEHFSARNCTSLTSSCRSMLLNEELHKEAGNKRFYLLGTSIPEWFEHRSSGLSISFWCRNIFSAISLCVVGGQLDERIIFFPKLIINGNIHSIYSGVYLEDPADHIHIFDRKQINIKDNVEWNHVVFSIDVCNNVQMDFVKQIGVHVFKNKSSMEDIKFADDYKRGKLDDDLITSESKNHMLLIKNDRLVDMRVSQTQFMQQQQNLALLDLLVRKGRVWISLPPTPTIKSLFNNVNCDSNSMLSTPISSTTNVQGCETVSRKRKFGTIDSEACEPFCEAPSKVALDSDLLIPSLASDPASEGGCAIVSKHKGKDLLVYNDSCEWLSMCPCWQEPLDYENWDSNSMKSASASDTIRDLGCEIESRKRKLGTLRLDLGSEASEPFCQVPSKVALNSDSMISNLASDTASGGGKQFGGIYFFLCLR